MRRALVEESRDEWAKAKVAFCVALGSRQWPGVGDAVTSRPSVFTIGYEKRQPLDQCSGCWQMQELSSCSMCA